MAVVSETVRERLQSRAGGPGGMLRSVPDGFRRSLAADAERCFLWMPVALAGGLLAYFALAIEPAWWQVAGLAALALVLAAVLGRRGRRWLALSILAVAFGFALGKVRTDGLNTPVVARDTAGVTVTAWVESVQIMSPGRQRAVLAVTDIQPPLPGARPHRLRISFSRRGGDLDAGSRISFKARLFRPNRPVAPGAFDFARRDWFAGIAGSGFAYGTVERDDDPGPRPIRYTLSGFIASVRGALADAVRQGTDGEAASFVVAVLTGMRGGLAKETVEQLRAAGLAHLLAISGLHMGLVAFTLFWLVRALLALSAHAALNWPIKKWSAMAALAGGAGYLVLSGAAVSTQRAYLMLTIVFLAVLFDRQAISMRNVAFAAMFILLLRPESVLNVSFQMSFLAVIGLVALYEARDAIAFLSPVQGTGGRLRNAMRFAWLYVLGVVLSTIVAGVATAPAAAYHFHRMALFGVLANLVAIPLMGTVIMPAALIGALLVPLGLEAVPLTIAGWGASLVLGAAEWAAGLPGALRHVPATPPVAFVLIVFGMLWVCLWRQPWRWFGCAVAALGLTIDLAAPRPDVLVAEDGEVMAVRNADGLLALSGVSKNRFALERWLAADGDDASPGDARARSGIDCDDEGCFALARGDVRVSLLGRASGLWDACRKADVVITAFSFHGPCPGADLVIDRVSLYRHGAHALYLSESGMTVERVSDRRGERPWSGHTKSQ